MNRERFARALRERNWDLLERIKEAPTEIAAVVAEMLPTLERDSREFAVACLAAHSGPNDGSLLLQMTEDEDIQIAGFAAQSLLSMSDLPAAETILPFLERSEDGFVRGYLYLAVGKTGKEGVLGRLQKWAAREKDPEAAVRLRAARARLGDPKARRELLESVRLATPDGAEEACELLLYVGDLALARGLLPWFRNTEAIEVVDPHGAAEPLRMCDFAVWIAVGLGIEIDPEPEMLEPFSAQTCDQARAVVEALPDFSRTP